jgi:nucleotide-binding universal stress UspA family protein
MLDGLVADDVWWLVRRQSTLVHVPDGVPWAFGRRPMMVAAASWLSDEGFAEEAAAVEHLVRRYLTAFGPATAADLAQWSGLSAAALRPGIDAVAERRFADERGRQLLDVADAPLPDADVPAPPRLLPMWDSTLLAFDDRTRMMSDEDRLRVIARNGDVAPTFIVDGRVGGLWWADHEGGRTHIELEPFRPLGAADRTALEAEGERMARFLEPLEPRVYGRYRTSGARRHA